MATRKASPMISQPSAAAAHAASVDYSPLPSLLAKLVDKASICKRSSMESIKELIDRELDEDSMSFFIAALLGTMDKKSKHFVESPSASLAHSVCQLVELVSKAAQTKQVKVRPCHICSILKSVVSWFPLDNGSQSHPLHQACAKLVCSLAENALTSSHDQEPGFEQLHHDCALLVDSLCRPLLGALCSRVEPVSMGASTCLDALVSMETWRNFASLHLVEELCYKASRVLQARTAISANTAQLSLLCNLARTNTESLTCYRSGLLKKGADILLNDGAIWQQRAAAARLMESFMLTMGASSLENEQDKKAVMDAIGALESCRLDKAARVRSVVGEALKAAKQQDTLHNLSLPVEESSSGHTKTSRLEASFCLQGPKTDYRKRRRKKPLGLHIENKPPSSFPCRSDHSANHALTSSMTNWSSSDSVNSSIDFEGPRRKVARVGCNYGRTLSSSANGDISTKTTRQSGAKKVVTSLRSLTSTLSSSSALSSASKSSSSTLSSKLSETLVPAYASASSSFCSSSTHTHSDDSLFSHSFLSSPSSSSTPFGNSTADTFCWSNKKVARAGCIRRRGSSAFCECVSNETGSTQELSSPTSSSASTSSSKPTIGETRAKDTASCLPSLSTYGIPPEETKEIALPLPQKEGTLVLEPSGFTSVDNNHMGEISPSCRSKVEESYLSSPNSSSFKKDVCNEDFVEIEGCSCTSPSSIHCNVIAQLESLEEIMSHQVCEVVMTQDNSVSACISRAIFSPSYNSCTRQFEQHLPADAYVGGNMPLESGNEVCSDSLVWRVRDNPIATDDSELYSPRPTIFDSYMVIYCDDRDNDDDEDRRLCMQPHQENDKDLDILSGHHRNDDWPRVHVGGEFGFLTSRDHQRIDGDDGVLPIGDEGLADHSVLDDDAYGNTKEACLLAIQEDDDANQPSISREHQQITVSNESANLVPSSFSDGYGGAGDNFSELSMLMEAHLRDHPELASEAGNERLECSADCEGYALVGDHSESDISTRREKKQSLKPAMATEDLKAYAVVENPCDEKDHGETGQREGSGNSVATWLSRFYIVKKCNVLFTPCGIFVLTLALPLAIVALNTLSTKEDTTHLLVPT